MLEQELKDWLKKSDRIVVAGIGNPIRKDDFVGTKIVQNLCRKTPENILLIECETVPESFLGDIVDFDPTHVLIIDAATLGVQPGETRLFTQDQLSDAPSISTHTLPLRIFCEYLSQTIKPKISLLLIQPESMEFGEGLSPKVQESAKKITKILTKLFK
jgi:hydrogenase 3 maturation protease